MNDKIIPFGKRRYRKSGQKPPLNKEVCRLLADDLIEWAAKMEVGDLREIALTVVRTDGQVRHVWLLPENPGELFKAMNRTRRLIVEHIEDVGIREPGD